MSNAGVEAGHKACADQIATLQEDNAKLREAVLDLARICEAVRFTSGLGKGQMERIERAKVIARRDKRFAGN